MTPDDAKMKTHDMLLVLLIIVLFFFGIAAYFFTPKDPENAKVIVAAFIAAIGAVLSFKFGIHQAQVPPGTSQLTKTVVPPVPDSNAVNNLPDPSTPPA